MLEIGRFYDLIVIKELPFGFYLQAEEAEILLPIKDAPAGLKIGDSIHVFLYKDSESRPVTTTRTPKIVLNGYACLEVMDVNKYGAFLDWGIENQLLVPFREQPDSRLRKGKKVVVKMYRDELTDRLVATTRLSKHLEKASPDLKEWQSVEILVYGHAEQGYRAVVDQKYNGLLYESEVYEPLKIGDIRQGFIRTIREDGKIDLSLRKKGLSEIIGIREKILDALQKSDGFLPVWDESTPEEIRDVLGVSKKSFKKACGILLKEGKISILPDGIHLLK